MGCCLSAQNNPDPDPATENLIQPVAGASAGDQPQQPQSQSLGQFIHGLWNFWESCMEAFDSTDLISDFNTYEFAGTWAGENQVARTGEWGIPASPDFVENLPNITYDASLAYPECTFCQVGFLEKESLKELPCKHYYHANCILQWLRKESTCPLCRYQLPMVNDDISSALQEDQS